MDHLQNTKKKYKNFKVTGDSQYIYQNEIYKACFQQYMAYGDFNYLTRGTTFDKILHDTAFNIGKNPKYDGYQMGLASTVYKRFDKKLLAAVFKIKLFLSAEELHKPIIRKFKKRKVHSPFIDNI